MRVIVALLFVASVASADDRFADTKIVLAKAAGQVHLLTGAGGNIAVFAGDDGVLIVDDQFAPLADRIKQAIAGLGKGEASWVINTHWHGDHTGGNAEFGRKAVIVAHDNVRKRLAVEQVTERGQTVPPQPKHGLPTVTFPQQLVIHLNGEEVRVHHLPQGHTDGDSAVHFTGSNVWHAGDHFFNGFFPYVDLSHGGTLNGYIANVETLLGMMDDGATVIPGHGPLSNKEGLAAWLGRVKASVAFIQAQARRGVPLARAQAAGLPKEFEAMGKGFIKTPDWIATVYKSQPKTEGRGGFPRAPFTQVKAFAMNLEGDGRPECLSPLTDGALCSSVQGRGKPLSPDQVARLQSLLNTRTTYGEGEPKCFIPHHGFVYYDADDKPVGEVALCFMCENLRATPSIPAQPASPMKSALSKKAVAAFRSLCSELDLPRCR